MADQSVSLEITHLQTLQRSDLEIIHELQDEKIA